MLLKKKILKIIKNYFVKFMLALMNVKFVEKIVFTH